ncbi:MAG: SLBB domain-containing protein, partial [Thermodesulfobacteriota bacterium]|nr:SLBB domain-containing protein [Thermodesulfobacteriota bacterium]
MRKPTLLLIVILSLILLASSSFSQNISRTEARKYLDTHPELKKYAIPESTPAPEKEDDSATDEEKPKGLTEAEEERERRAFRVRETEEAIILPVFGHRLFSAGPASFTPPSNMPVTADYIVGPDDNIIVQLWGRINEQYDLTVQRDGSIQFPQIGTIQVAGLTYKQLQDLIKREVESITGVNVSVSMGKLRSITVFVVGAVKKPGAYTVSAFDTLLNALIYAGGPEIIPPQKPYESRYPSGESSYVPMRDKEIPSVKEFATRLKKEKELREKRQRYDKLDADQIEREIKVLERIEKRQENIDQLKQILAEKKSAEESEKTGSMKVQELEEEIRKIEGSKTPERQLFSRNLYVFIDREKEKEILMSVLLGSMRNIQLKRRGKTVTTFDLYDLILKGDNSRDVRLEPGDIIFVPKPGAAVAICGDVKVPAVYELKQDRKLTTVLDLAGGINPSAYSEQIQIQRYLENRERIILDMSIDQLKKQKRPFLLQNGDVVRIFPVVKEDANAVYLFGNVMRPGKYEYSPEMRITDVIKVAEDLKPETY